MYMYRQLHQFVHINTHKEAFSYVKGIFTVLLNIPRDMAEEQIACNRQQ